MEPEKQKSAAKKEKFKRIKHKNLIEKKKTRSRNGWSGGGGKEEMKRIINGGREINFFYFSFTNFKKLS